MEGEEMQGMLAVVLGMVSVSIQNVGETKVNNASV
jgi:hypothetical protein